MRKTPLKGGPHLPLGSLCRVDPTHRGGGKAHDPRDERPRRAEGVPAGMVAVSSGTHQAVAKRSHEASHRAKHTTTGQYPPRGEDPDPDEASEATAAVASLRSTHAAPPKAGLLTDEQWELVRALLPKQKPGQGRPRHDDRQVLRGILWIMDTGAWWRDLPEEFGPNSTAHGRYRKWCKEGLWSRIVEALGR